MVEKKIKQWLPAVLGLTLVGLLVIGLTAVAPVAAQGPGMMGGNSSNRAPGYGYGSMMGNGGYGNMGYGSAFTGTMPYGYGDMMGNGGFGGMMDGSMMGNGGFGGMMGGSMMGNGGFGGMMDGSMMGNGGFGGMMGGFLSGLFKPDPITLNDATAAVETYITGLNDDNLKVGEVMVFDNHAYAEIVEKDSGIGAMEVLIDPVTGSISPEPGANMMWNRKYGMMTGFAGMMGNFDAGSMMDDSTFTPTDVTADMPVSAEDAVKIAQAYLDNYTPGNLTVENTADPFYGYYTIHVLRDGKTAGMLSVNGYTRQVLLHTWHGDFVEMSEE